MSNDRWRVYNRARTSLLHNGLQFTLAVALSPAAAMGQPTLAANVAVMRDEDLPDPERPVLALHQEPIQFLVSGQVMVSPLGQQPVLRYNPRGVLTIGDKVIDLK